MSDWTGIVRVDPDDAHLLSALKDLVCECEDLYPGIDIWFQRKVLSGLKDGSRVGLLVVGEGGVEGGTIIKPGHLTTKICNFRIRSEFASAGVGRVLMHEVAQIAPGDHLAVTVEEELATQIQGALASFGFHAVGRAGQNYRGRGQDEQVFKGFIQDVMQRTKPKGG